MIQSKAKRQLGPHAFAERVLKRHNAATKRRKKENEREKTLRNRPFGKVLSDYVHKKGAKPVLYIRGYV